MYVNGVKTCQFKVKVPGIKPYPLRVGNISNDVTVDNMKTTGLNGCVNDFSVDYNTIDVSDIVDLFHKYLMKRE